MRYATAVRRLRQIAEDAHRANLFGDDPVLLAVYAWFFRPATRPVSNHVIREPLRIWSPDGVDEQALTALAEGRDEPLRLPAPSRSEQRDQQLVELAAAGRHLRRVRDDFWDPEWRRDHQGDALHPEDHLHHAVSGYLDLLDVDLGSEE